MRSVLASRLWAVVLRRLADQDSEWEHLDRLAYQRDSHLTGLFLFLFVCTSGVGTKSTLRGRGDSKPMQRAEPEVGFLERGWEGLGSAVSSPSGVLDESPAAKSFSTFWVLQVSSPAVLLLDRGVIHSGFCGSARKLLRGRKDTFAPAVSALRRGQRPRCPRGSDAFATTVLPCRKCRVQSFMAHPVCRMKQ